jgi:hypothetical protein
MSRRTLGSWGILILALLFCAEVCGRPTLMVPAREATKAGLVQKADDVSPLSSASASVADTYYVDGANGSDANPGTSRDQAWRTIQNAADMMTAGDTCIVLAGEHAERVHVSTSASAGAPIVFQAEGTVVTKGFTVHADYITIQGFEITDTDNDWEDGVGIFVEGSHCIIEDNYVHYATRGGILIYASPGEESLRTDCLVRNNRLYRNSQWGITINGRNHVVEGNEIWGTIQYHPNWVDPPGWVDADGMRFFGAGHLVRGNYIHDIIFDDPENVDPHIDCFQTWGDSDTEAGHDIVFDRNFCENLNERMYAFMLKGSTHLIIRNNIILACGGVNTGALGTSNLTIVSNLFANRLSFPESAYPGGVGLEDSPNATVKNNIFYDQPTHHISVSGTSSESLDAGCNLIYRSDGEEPHGSPYPDDLWGVDPLFVDASTGDYHLQSASPVIDAGCELLSLAGEDYDGNSRPKGPGYDIGAYEYTADASLIGELIIDDTDPGFSTSFDQDAWQEFVDIDGQHYGYGHHYNHQMGSGSDTATWSFSLPRPGEYRIYAWWYEGGQRPTDVPYTVNHPGGSTTIRVNQQINGGRWNLLGTFTFQDQGSVVLSDDASSGQDIVADAIKLEYVWPYYTYLPFVTRHHTSP